MKEKQIDFGNEKVAVVFRKLFFPTLLGMLSLSAVTTIDGIFVGHGVGSDGIAAVNLCIPLLMLITGIGLMVGAGCSVMASVFLSKGKISYARATVTQAMFFVTLIAMAVNMMIWLFPERMAYWLGTSSRLLPMVIDYLVWFAPSLLFQLWVAVALFAIRLDGSPKLAMWCSIISAFVNVVFDWLFIFPLGWGVMGAALATSLSCLCGAVIALGYLLFHARTLRLHALRFDRRGMVFFFRNIGMQCKIGSSALFGELTMAVLFFVGNHLFMYYLGDDGVGAFGVSCYYLPFVFMIGNAIAQSAQPIISYNFGIRNNNRVHWTLYISIITALICGAVSTVAFLCFPERLVGLFLSEDTRSARIAISGFPYYGAGFIFFVLNLAIIGYYQSLERVKPTTLFAILRGFVFLVPCFVLLPELMGTKGIWLALTMSEMLTLMVMFLTFAFRYKMRIFSFLKS